MSNAESIKVLLVDPSRFTVPYDAQLGEGLAQCGVQAIWATRPRRAHEGEGLPELSTHEIFYRRTDRPHGIPRFAQGPLKALAHVWGLLRLIRLARRMRPDVVHFQWTLLPILDGIAIWLLSRVYPVFLTVHDSVPFNGHRMPFLLRFASDFPISLAQRVIVHSKTAKATLVKRGIDAAKIAVVPHGPLPLEAPAAVCQKDDRWTFAMFGYLKPYKGIDLVIEAAGRLRDQIDGKARFIIAGAAQMDMAPLHARVSDLALGDMVELRVGYLSNENLGVLLNEGDCILFPYRQIDASGAYFMAKPLGKWIIASRVGVFADDIADKETGDLVPPGEVEPLAAAILQAVIQRPVPSKAVESPSWNEIGRLTRAEYEVAMQSRHSFISTHPGLPSGVAR